MGRLSPELLDPIMILKQRGITKKTSKAIVVLIDTKTVKLSVIPVTSTRTSHKEEII